VKKTCFFQSSFTYRISEPVRDPQSFLIFVSMF